MDNPEKKTRRAPSKLDALRDAERRVREAEVILVNEKAENVRLENEGIRRELEAVRIAERLNLVDERYKENSDTYHRTFNFIEDVNYLSTFQAMKVVSAWNRMAHAPIVVRFTSPGGSVYDGFALYDQLKAIDLTGSPITTVNIGWSASMAGILMQAGSRRIMAPNAQFMVHEVAEWSYGFKATSASDSEEEARLLRKLNNRLYSVLIEGNKKSIAAGTAKTELTVAKLNDLTHKKEWWLDAEEAVAYGLVDEIGYL